MGSMTIKEAHEIALALVLGELDRLQKGERTRLTGDVENTLKDVKSNLEWMLQMPPTIMLQKGWSFAGWTIGEPILEQLSEGRVRLVVDVTGGAASELRSKFQLALVPAAIDATEAIVRATHALAGAAIEMTHVLKKLQEKT